MSLWRSVRKRYKFCRTDSGGWPYCLLAKLSFLTCLGMLVNEIQSYYQAFDLTDENLYHQWGLRLVSSLLWMRTRWRTVWKNCLMMPTEFRTGWCYTTFWITNVMSPLSCCSREFRCGCNYFYYWTCAPNNFCGYCNRSNLVDTQW